MKKRETKRRLYIPLYIYFFLSILAANILVGFFENYSMMQYDNFARSVANADFMNLVQEMMNEDPSEVTEERAEEFEIKMEEEFGNDYRRRISEKYPEYPDILNMGLLITLVIFIWLIPIYKFNFLTKSSYNEKVEKRVIYLPLLVFVLPWVVGLARLIMQWGFHYDLLQTWDDNVYSTYFVSFLIFGSLVGNFNLGITTRYINKRIAANVFKGENLYRIKKGKSLSLTFRITSLIVSVAILPLLLNLYIPTVFNSWVFQALANKNESEYLSIARILIPLISMTIVNLYFIVLQISAISSFKKNIQKPLNGLIDKMNDVAHGDFETRTSVLATDEIGMLKGNFNHMVEGLAEREKIRDTFGKFVSMEIAEKLMESGGIDLEGEEIETTVMFADIRNFTSFSENYTPRELIEFLNLYFSYIVKPIQDNNGVINKFIGDSVMAVFSPVFGVNDHAEAGLKAALGMRKALNEFNELNQYPEIHHGIGLHTGTLIAGNVGAEQRMEYTVIGDVVNVASRIESQTKIFNSDILLSEKTYQKLEKAKYNKEDFKPNDPVIMKGKSKSMILYTVDKKLG